MENTQFNVSVFVVVGTEEVEGLNFQEKLN